MAASSVVADSPCVVNVSKSKRNEHTAKIKSLVNEHVKTFLLK